MFYQPGTGIDSLAVLPFTDLSGDEEQEYFSDGMTESLINEVGQIGALRVISRTSVMQSKKTDKSLQEIAQALNVDAVVEASVVRKGDRIRITAQLIQVEPEEMLRTIQDSRICCERRACRRTDPTVSRPPRPQ
jgi:TolB-like protein